jgi:PPOX class probable FMN-dependent enzyme
VSVDLQTTGTCFDDYVAGRVSEHHALSDYYGAPAESVVHKVASVIDSETAAWVRATSLIFLSTYGADGRCDVTPRGGPPGFARMLDERVVAIPDVPGNRRLDSMHNIIDTGRIGALFVVPGRTDAVRCNGRALVTSEPGLLRQFDTGRKPPLLAIVMEVDEVFIHCSSALARSNAWRPDRWVPPEAAPTMDEMWAAHLASNGHEGLR